MHDFTSMATTTPSFDIPGMLFVLGLMEPFLVRSAEDFLGTQLSLLPLPADHPAVQTSAKSVGWLLKTLAIELRVVSAARMRSQVG